MTDIDSGFGRFEQPKALPKSTVTVVKCMGFFGEDWERLDPHDPDPPEDWPTHEIDKGIFEAYESMKDVLYVLWEVVFNQVNPDPKMQPKDET